MQPNSSLTRIFLVRHGGTTATADDRFSGSQNVLLSEEGIEQAKKLAVRLKDVKIDAAYSSNMQRALMTIGHIVHKHDGLRPVAVHALREINHGHWEGLPHHQVETTFAAEYAKWIADPFDYAIPGGESGASVLARASRAVAAIVENHPNQTVLIVSHKATNRLLLSHWLGFDPRRYRDRLSQETCCLNIVEFSATGPRVVLMNDTSHYQNIPNA